VRRFLLLCFISLVAVVSLDAADTASIQGTVTDSSGAAIQDAAVSLMDLTTHQVVHMTTGANGQFVFKTVPSGLQIVTIEKSGFETFTQRVSTTQPSVTIEAKMNVASSSDSVVVRGTVDPEAKPMPTREDVMVMPETIRVLDRKQLEAAGPMAGGSQMIQSAPGANVVGYGETGATKYTVLLNGIQQGWSGEATSFTAPGSLGVAFDGIPIADPATGLWQSAAMPQSLTMQNVAVTYGPGQPMDRWYTNVGGQVEFTPVQPTLDRHLSAAVTDGPYGQQNFAFVGNTGSFKGWSTVLGGGLGSGDDFRQAPDGFGNPTKDGSVFGKTVKSFSAGSIAFGSFYAKGGGYRPTVIPTTDIGLVEPNTNGTHFSQATSGFYSALPYADYNKYDTNEMFVGYGRERLYLSPKSTLQNSTWYTHIRRFTGAMRILSPRDRRWTSGTTRTATSLGMKWACPRNCLTIRSNSAATYFMRPITRTTFSLIPPLGAAARSKLSAQEQSFAPDTSSRTTWRSMSRTIFIPFRKSTSSPECARWASPPAIAIRRSATSASSRA
jgi:iron complex outermembrane receptor protein